MPFFKSMGETLADIVLRDPDTYKFMCLYADKVMRGSSPLTEGQRELLAAYVSALNDCQYCHNTHAYTAQAFGLELTVLEGLVEDVNSAPVDESLKPIFHFVRKLTLSPAKMREADAQAVFEAGWSEAALESALQVCALFSLYNRLVDGYGIKASDRTWRERGRFLKEIGYGKGLLDRLGIE